MNLFELLVFMLMVSLGVGTSMAAGHVGGIWFGILGFPLGFLFLPFLAFLHWRYRKWAYHGDTWMPDCCCGTNKFNHERIDKDHRLVCEKCGATYKKHRDQVWIFENDEKRIYKRLVRFKGWI